MLNTPLDCEKSKGEVGEREGVDVTPAPPTLILPLPLPTGRADGQEIYRQDTSPSHPLPPGCALGRCVDHLSPRLLPLGLLPHGSHPPPLAGGWEFKWEKQFRSYTKWRVRKNVAASHDSICLIWILYYALFSHRGVLYSIGCTGFPKKDACLLEYLKSISSIISPPDHHSVD